MHLAFEINEEMVKADLLSPIDLSIELQGGKDNLTVWYQGPPVITPVKGENFIGDVNQGGSVNFRDIYFNPHAHCTHTECVGHISKENVNVNDVLKKSLFSSFLITISPEKLDSGDEVITLNQIKTSGLTSGVEALIIRTQPNGDEKKHRNYSHTNPPYVEPIVMKYLIDIGVQHLLIDLPSVDREEDEGALAAHKAFWNYPEELNKSRTITELIFVDDSVKDGRYLLNLQTANIKNDATPSRPVIYPLLNE